MMRDGRNVNLNNNALYGGFNRLRDFPLDSSSVVNTKEDLIEYLRRDTGKHSIAYVGQLIGVKETGDIIVVKTLPPVGQSITYEELDVYVKSMSTTDDIKVFKTEVNQLIADFEKEAEEKYATKQKLSELDKVLAEVPTKYATKAQVETVEADVKKISETYATKEQLTSEIKDVKDAVQVELNKLLDNNTEGIIDSFKEVREEFDAVSGKFEAVQKWIDDNETEIGKIADIEGLRSDLKTLTEEFKVVQGNYATDNELDDAITAAVNKLLGADLERIEGALDTIKEIDLWIKEHEDEFDRLAGLADGLDKKLDGIQSEYTKEITGIKDTQTSQQQAIAGLNTSTASLEERSNLQAEQILEQDKKINQVTESIADQEERIQAAESRLENLSGDYVTKEELESLVGQIDISGIERTLSIDFVSTRYAGSDKVIPKDAIIKDIEIYVKTPASEILPYSEVYGNRSREAQLVILQKVLDDIDKIEDEAVLIYDDMIDEEVIQSIDELPETFIYDFNYKVKSENGVKVRLEIENFRDITGTLFVKYYISEK